MTDAVFDTTVFIDLYYGHKGALELLAGVRVGRLSAAYSPLTVYELWLRPMNRAEEIFHVSVLTMLTEVPLDAASARQVADWLRPLSRQQRQRLAADAIIAAAASSADATIYTRNPSDFTRFYPNVEAY